MRPHPVRPLLDRPRRLFLALRLAGASVLASLLAAAPAAAQIPADGIARGSAPTLGPEIPAPLLGAEPDAFSVVVNPANLGFLRAWSATGLYTWLRDPVTRGPG